MRNWAMAAVAGLILLAGCGSKEDPSGFWDDYYDEPPPRTGPASVSGTLTITAPVLRLGDAPLDADAPSVCGSFNYPGRVGVFATDSTWPDGEVVLESTGYSAIRSAAGSYEIAFDFPSIPADTYELRVFNVYYPDWGIRDYLESFASPPFTLSAQQPHLDDLSVSWDLTGGQAGGTLRGCILVSGNPPFNSSAAFTLRSREGEDSFYWHQSNHQYSDWLVALEWRVPTGDSAYGRIFYELSGLPLESYSDDPNRSGDYLHVTEPGEYEDWPYVVELSESQPALQADYYTTTNTSTPDAGTGGSRPYTHGSIGVDLDLTVDEGWQGHLVLVAERADGVTDVFHRSVTQVAPSFYEPDSEWRREPDFSLGHLEQGEYHVRLLSLGDTNDQQPTVLAELDEPVALVAPPPTELQFGEHVYHRYNYPTARVSLEAEVRDP